MTMIPLSKEAQAIQAKISPDTTKLGDLKKIAQTIKTDHELALELWTIKEFRPRLFATLVLDKKLLTQEVIERLARDLEEHDLKESNQLADWLLANQLMNPKTLTP